MSFCVNPREEDDGTAKAINDMMVNILKDVKNFQKKPETTYDEYDDMFDMEISRLNLQIDRGRVIWDYIKDNDAKLIDLIRNVVKRHDGRLVIMNRGENWDALEITNDVLEIVRKRGKIKGRTPIFKCESESLLKIAHDVVRRLTADKNLG